MYHAPEQTSACLRSAPFASWRERLWGLKRVPSSIPPSNLERDLESSGPGQQVISKFAPTPRYSNPSRPFVAGTRGTGPLALMQHPHATRPYHSKTRSDSTLSTGNVISNPIIKPHRRAFGSIIRINTIRPTHDIVVMTGGRLPSNTFLQMYFVQLRIAPRRFYCHRRRRKNQVRTVE
jgi:hypothetical protein